MNDNMKMASQNKQTMGESSVAEMARTFLSDMVHLIQAIDVSALEQVVNHLHSARQEGACVYVMGNGGSAATASHFANDLAKASKKAGRFPSRAFCLNDNTPWLTALANDEGYENVFSGQLENHLRVGDVVIAISASGNSKNLVRAVELAKSRGAITIGILGFDGGILRSIVDINLLIASRLGEYEPVEDIHLMLAHVIAICLSQV
jgi:D-sedoheptulose 7-phosphate isomerase